MFEINEFEAKMKKTISVYEEELAGIRVGRATPSVLNKIMIDYYGTPTPITQIGEVKTPDARTLLVTPWENNLLKAVEHLSASGHCLFGFVGSANKEIKMITAVGLVGKNGKADAC